MLGVRFLAIFIRWEGRNVDLYDNIPTSPTWIVVLFASISTDVNLVSSYDLDKWWNRITPLETVLLFVTKNVAAFTEPLYYSFKPNLKHIFLGSGFSGFDLCIVTERRDYLCSVSTVRIRLQACVIGSFSAVFGIAIGSETWPL